MTRRTKQCIAAIVATVSASVTCFLLLLWWGHFTASAQTADTVEDIAENQTRLVEIVDRLSSIHDAEEAADMKVAELCYAGIVTDCKICAKAKVILDRCVD